MPQILPRAPALPLDVVTQLVDWLDRMAKDACFGAAVSTNKADKAILYGCEAGYTKALQMLAAEAVIPVDAPTLPADTFTTKGADDERTR